VLVGGVELELPGQRSAPSGGRRPRSSNGSGIRTLTALTHAEGSNLIQEPEREADRDSVRERLGAEPAP